MKGRWIVVEGVWCKYRAECVFSSGCCLCAVWKPKTMNVSQLGSNLHVVFERAPSSFGFTLYYLYYKLRQDGPFKLQRCKPVSAHGGESGDPVLVPAVWLPALAKCLTTSSTFLPVVTTYQYLFVWCSASSLKKCSIYMCRGRHANNNSTTTTNSFLVKI